MAETTAKAKHAFGDLSRVNEALAAGTIDAYDILFLKDGEIAKVGWIDKDGNPVIVEDKEQIVRVDALPIENGDENVLYIYNNIGYIWNGMECVPVSESAADISELEASVSALQVAMNTKVDEKTVDEKIDAALAGIEIIEF